MISSVSAVSFKANAPAQDPISRPGAFTKPETPVKQEAPKKKGKFWKGLAAVVVAALVVGGGLIAGKKANVLKTLDNGALKDANIWKKAGHYLAKAGEWLDGNILQKIPGLAKKAESVNVEA